MMTTTQETIETLAKYPFKKAAEEYVDGLNLTLPKIVKPEYKKALDRAEDRLAEAISKAETSRSYDHITELLSFPIANMFVIGIGDSYLDRRYALSEAVRVRLLLESETPNFVFDLAQKEFGWNIKPSDMILDGRKCDFKLYFADYLRNAAGFKTPRWKLINRLLHNGFVEITSIEAIRLLQEEVRRRIENLVSNHEALDLPHPLQMRVKRLQALYAEHRKLSQDDFPAEVDFEALPPCIAFLFEGFKIGRKAGHPDRFALTAFFLNVGMSPETLTSLYQSLSDFDPDFTRYQVEHIGGSRGSRIGYTAPACKWMMTHGLCVDTKKERCVDIRHPLTYYRRRARKPPESP